GLHIQHHRVYEALVQEPLDGGEGAAQPHRPGVAREAALHRTPRLGPRVEHRHDGRHAGCSGAERSTTWASACTIAVACSNTARALSYEIVRRASSGAYHAQSVMPSSVCGTHSPRRDSNRKKWQNL